jgi:catechol 2,3-dioxygenase-like lactoylglutathione lyase family enzyme
VSVFDHVGIRVSDLHASRQFYETVLGAVEIEQSYADERLVEWDDFAMSPATAEKPVTRRLHVAFAAPSRAHVDRFWEAGTEAGYRDDGPPGPRPEYRADYYGSFLLDPDGNSAEAVHHGALRRGGHVDHLWMRVAEVLAAKRFYETIASQAGIRLNTDAPNHVQFVGAGGSFSLVRGEPTEHVHLAFPALDDATVDAFHRVATAAGYRDNGGPGERPEYHAGYHGAFVLDPDGNNIEVVHHNRPQQP